MIICYDKCCKRKQSLLLKFENSSVMRHLCFARNLWCAFCCARRHARALHSHNVVVADDHIISGNNIIGSACDIHRVGNRRAENSRARSARESPKRILRGTASIRTRHFKYDSSPRTITTWIFHVGPARTNKKSTTRRTHASAKRFLPNGLDVFLIARPRLLNNN